MAGKLYCYFNQNGDLVETITDGTVRKGDAGIDTIYVYIEDAPTYTNVSQRYLINTTVGIETLVTKVSCVGDDRYIPVIKNQDLKYFEYGKSYDTMWKFTLPTFTDNGPCALTLRLYGSGGPGTTPVMVLGAITFTIANAVAKPSTEISESQYNYLLSIIERSVEEAVWGDISGDIENQTDLIDKLKERLQIIDADDYNWDILTEEQVETIVKGCVVKNSIDCQTFDSGGDGIILPYFNSNKNKYECVWFRHNQGDDSYEFRPVKFEKQQNDTWKITSTESLTSFDFYKKLIANDGLEVYDGLTVNSGSLETASGATLGSNLQSKINTAVAPAIQNVREVAEGKCKSFVVSTDMTEPTTDAQAITYKKADGTAFTGMTDYNSYTSRTNFMNGEFDSQDEELDYSNKHFITDSKVVVPYVEEDAIKTGDIILVTDTEVPDRWCDNDSDTFNILETAKVDIANMVTTDTTQTITGVKTFSNGANTSNYKIREDGLWFTLSRDNTGIIQFYPGFVKPYANNNTDLGNTATKWKDLYLSGTAYIGNNGFQISDLGANSIYLNAGAKNIVCYCTALSTASANQDLGESGRKWRNLYLSGKLTDETNEITVANIQPRNSVISDSSSTTFSNSLTSNQTYTFATALTSLAITGLTTQTGDNNPKWTISFIVGTGFAITLPTGVNWSYGTPTWETGIEYTIVIKKSVVNNNYIAYQIRG